MNNTFKDIITKLEEFATNHLQINDFGWGDIANISTKDHIFTMLWLYPTVSEKTGQSITLRFDMYIIDILEQDRSNLLDVMNNTMLIGNDVIAYFWEDNYDLDFELNEESVSITPFEGRFDDLTGGWVYSIEIIMKSPLSGCNIPIA